jgi:hypothetical protein
MRVLTMRLPGIFLLSFALFASPARAADISVVSDDEIRISGEIVEGDGAKFVALFAARRMNPEATVSLASGGGLLGEATVIGLTIRERGLVTYVPKGDCYSACALIWLGGTKLFRHPKSEIGFHQSFDHRTGAPQGNAMVGFYLAKLGYEIQTSLFVTEAAPSTIKLLTDKNAGEAGIAYQTLDIEAGRRLDFADGSYYVGKNRNGQPHGAGTKYFKNGDVYSGEWKDGLRDGKGVITFANGDRYEGNFQEDEFHLFGKMIYYDGSIYDGAWSAGEPEGFGTFRYADGGRYAGGWKGGRKHGKGTFFHREGSEFSGIWVNGIKEGEGIYKSSSKKYGIVFEHGFPIERK